MSTLKYKHIKIGKIFTMIHTCNMKYFIITFNIMETIHYMAKLILTNYKYLYAEYLMVSYLVNAFSEKYHLDYEIFPKIHKIDFDQY